jgi:hypothetical protein
MYRTALSFLMISAMALTACGDDDLQSPPVVEPEFELTISGAVEETASGPAWFGSDVDDDGNPVFMLLMGQDTSRHLVMVGKSGSVRPEPGSYDIVDVESTASGWTAMHLVSEDDELVGMFFAESGTLTITESSSEVLRGSMEFEGVGFVGASAQAAITVTATFVAAPAENGAALFR